MGIKVTWLSHSAFSLDIGGKKVLVDPFLTGNPLAAANHGEIAADYILLTHGHGDHLGDTIPIATRTNAPVIAPVEITNWLKKQGVQRVHGQNSGGSFTHPFGRVKFVQAIHSSSLPDGTYGGLACGIVITAEGKNLYFAGDTALFSDMRLIEEMGIDVAFVPIGGNYTMGPDDSLTALKLIQPNAAFPIHYNTFDTIVQDAGEWARRVTNTTTALAIVLDPGSTFTVD